MNKASFLDTLHDGLRGMPRGAAEEIMADYEGHFADGLAAGRSEEDVASALGDPRRLARELRTEAGIRQWEEKKTASSATTAVFAILGLGAIDFLILLPILGPIIVCAFVLYIVVIGLFFVGVAVFVSSLVGLGGDGVLIGALGGVGLMAGSVAWGALHTLVCIGIVNALVWYGRLHLKVIKPAIGE